MNSVDLVNDVKNTDKKPNKISASMDWDRIRELETHLLQSMSVQESLLQYQQLQSSFEWQIQQTAGLFEASRRQTLIELQDQLHKHALWKSSHGKPALINPKDTTAPY